MKSPVRWFALAGALGLALGAVAFWLHTSYPGLSGPGHPRARGLICSARSSVSIGGPMRFTDHLGNSRSEQDLMGKPSLLFFGFTACPDVCPLTLQYMAKMLADAKIPAKSLNIVMVTLDPERDSTAELARYVASGGFPEGLIGARIESGHLDGVVRSFAGTYRKTALPDSRLEYTIDHTALIYLLDHEWRFKTFFTPSDQPQDVARCLRASLQEARGKS